MAIILISWILFGKFVLWWSNKTPPINEMTEWQLIDQMRVLQQEKEEQVNDLDMEWTILFLEGDESKFASINKEIENLSGMIASKSSSAIPKYEAYRLKLQEMTPKEVEKTPSELLEESLGF